MTNTPVWISFFILLIAEIVLSDDGNWSGWSPWEPCSVSCGEGMQKRFRACTNPPPSFGGAWCKGKARETQICQAPFECPVDGGWSVWSVWTACSASCGEGVRQRFRRCDSPPPTNGGMDCEGPTFELMTCFALKECPRDGQWSSWSKWSACSVTCGNDGSRFRYRSCNNPPPQADGKPCAGKSQESKKCKASQACSVNGQWSEWNEWSSCSVTCGSGVRRRWRRCDSPPPQNGGRDCERAEAGEIQERSCNSSIVFCPVHGNWSDWSAWGPCTTRSCLRPDVPSLRIRGRTCSDPYPEHEGMMCQGTFLDAAMCEGPTNCAVDGQWGEWAPWTCTKFVAVRKRQCNNPEPSNGGKPCKGKDNEDLTFEDNGYNEACPDIGDNENVNIGGDDEDFNGSGSGSGDGAM